MVMLLSAVGFRGMLLLLADLVKQGDVSADEACQVISVVPGQYLEPAGVYKLGASFIVALPDLRSVVRGAVTEDQISGLTFIVVVIEVRLNHEL